ncbi:MAG: serine hydrolase [Acidobacteriota bacterium]
MVLVGIAIPVTGAVDADRLTAFTEKGMELWHVPGLSVAVVTADEVLFRRGFGATAIENGKPVDEHTLFAIASTTKAMVVSGILILVDEEKLSLDDPIIKHIPELHFGDPSLTQQLTVRDLLAHRTGLPSTDYWGFFQNIPLDEQLTLLRTVQPAAPVRTRLIYQNPMFEIAGLLIERLTDKRWDHFVAERLWEPIGMAETYGARGQIGAEQSHAIPYFFFDDQLTVARWDIPADSAEAAGSVWSSIHDMSLWAQFLLRDGVTASGDRLISKESIVQMFEPHQLAAVADFYPTTAITEPNWRSYGLAWFQQDFQGRKIDFHTGSLSGLIAMIGLDRAGDKAVVVLSNRDHAEMRHALLWEVMDNGDPGTRRDWNQEIFDLYEGRTNEREEKWQETQQKRLENTEPSLTPGVYVGAYRSETFGDILIEQDAQDMKLRTTLVDLEMKHWHLDTFLLEYKPWGMREFVVFKIGPDGAVASFDFIGDTFERVEEEKEPETDAEPVAAEHEEPEKGEST